MTAPPAAPLQHATPARLVTATEDNLVALFRAMADRLPGGDWDEAPALGRHHAFPTNPMFKGVWRTRLAAGDVDAAIDDTIRWFRDRGAPYFFWWTTDATTPADLGARLEARGLLSMEAQQHALASGIVQTHSGAPILVADLHAMHEAVLGAVPPGFTIEPVADDDALDAFRDVFVEVYGIPAWAGQAWADATRAIGIGRTPWRMFLGRLDGRPVATNMLFCGGGVASVYAVAAHSDVRGRGIGGAITLAPLLDARAEGYRYAVLFSTELGVGAYARIGFRPTGATLNRYLWRGEG